MLAGRYWLTGDALPLIQKGGSVSVTSESITQSTGYPLCEACPGEKVWIWDLTVSARGELLTGT